LYRAFVQCKKLLADSYEVRVMETEQISPLTGSGNPLIEAAFQRRFGGVVPDEPVAEQWPLAPAEMEHHWNIDQEWVGV